MTDTFGRIMLDIESTSLSEEDKSVIRNKHVGGIIFFSKNFESYTQMKKDQPSFCSWSNGGSLY